MGHRHVLCLRRPRGKTPMLIGWWEETFTCPACELALHSLHLAALQEISMIGLVNCTSQREPGQCTRSEWQSVPTSNKISVCSHILWSFTHKTTFLSDSSLFHSGSDFPVLVPAPWDVILPSDSRNWHFCRSSWLVTVSFLSSSCRD